MAKHTISFTKLELLLFITNTVTGVNSYIIYNQLSEHRMETALLTDKLETLNNKVDSLSSFGSNTNISETKLPSYMYFDPSIINYDSIRSIVGIIVCSTVLYYSYSGYIKIATFSLKDYAIPKLAYLFPSVFSTSKFISFIQGDYTFQVEVQDDSILSLLGKHKENTNFQCVSDLLSELSKRITELTPGTYVVPYKGGLNNNPPVKPEIPSILDNIPSENIIQAQNNGFLDMAEQLLSV